MNRNINREILRISIPAILNNITVPLLGLCDTAIAGHLGSAAYLAAVSVGAMMLNVVYWLFGFLRMGTSGLTAQAYGAGDINGTIVVLLRSLTIAVVSALLILILQNPLLDVLYLIISAEKNVADLAGVYYHICIVAVPAQLCMMAFSGWFVGFQNTVYPMIIAVSVNIINIIASLTLVFLFKVGFAGIAYGTLIANWLGLLFSVFMSLRLLRKTNKSFGLRNLRLKNQLSKIFNGASLSGFFSVNGDLFLRSACIMTVSLTVTAIGARLGAMTLAVNAVMMQFFMFFSYFMDGFAFSGEALCGKFKGAGNVGMLRKSVDALLVWGAGMAALFLVVYVAFSGNITSFLTDDPEVRIIVHDYRIWIYLLPPLTVLAFIFDGIFIGVTKTRRMLVSTLIATSLYFAILMIPSIKTGIYTVPDNRILWTAFEAYLLARGILLALQRKVIYIIDKQR